jgi:peptide deformylase
MPIVALAEDDPRLREASVLLSRRELHLREQQTEIDELLDFVYGKGNKKVPRAARDRNRPGTVGLSANQVGIMKQICVVDLSIRRRGYFDLHVLVNPRIVWRSKTTVEKTESCVNFTTIWGKTRQSNIVQAEAWDRSGNEISLKLTGWGAVLLQHEVDHLGGRLFIDRLADPVRADLVLPSEYLAYRKDKVEWPNKIDVSGRVR